MATEIIKTLHYDGEVEINFYPNNPRMRYRLAGQRTGLIGVTTATGMLDKSTPLLIWAERLTQKYLDEAIENGYQITKDVVSEAINQRNIRLDDAALTGTQVHDWAEAHIKGEKPEIPKDERVRNGVLGFLKWVKKYDVQFLESEVRVFSRKHEYVGTMDTIFTMGSEDHKIKHAGDFKTGSGVYMGQAFQVSAYQEAYAEEHMTIFGSKWILRFVKEDKFKDGVLKQRAGDFEAKEFKAEEHESHFNGFLACLELKRQDKAWNKLHGFYAKKK